MTDTLLYAKKPHIINQIQRHLEQIRNTNIFLLTPKLMEQLTTRSRPFLSHYSQHRLIIINWGITNFPPQLQIFSNIINHPNNIKFMKNKLQTLKLLSHINSNHIPFWTENIDIAKTWLPNRVFCRTLHSSSQGNGIVICEKDQTLPPAAFYTKDTQAKHEYRIHFSTLGIFLIQKKARKHNNPPITADHKKIKNHKNGWIFKTMITTPEKENLATALTHTLLTFLKETNLDFGAADVSYNEKHRKYSILEINSAPGIANSTTRAYANMLSNLINVRIQQLYNIGWETDITRPADAPMFDIMRLGSPEGINITRPGGPGDI